MGPLAEDPRRLPVAVKQAPDGKLWQLEITLPSGKKHTTQPAKLEHAYAAGQVAVDKLFPFRGYIVA